MNRTLVGGLLVSVAGMVFAQGVPVDIVAAPEFYKVRAENDQYRIVEGTWKPGQRDVFHSHPAMLYYWLTRCTVRSHYPDGSVREFEVVANQAGSQPPIASHALENAGTSECRILMFEAK